MNLGQQHMHARVRVFKNLEKFPSEDTFKKYLDYLIYVVGIIQPLALIPQIVSIYGSRDAAGLSALTWGLLGCANALWALYGAVHRERIIVIANAFMMTLDIVIVVGILLYS
jgi:uncharacterized protein with PQ loop repeat